MAFQDYESASITRREIHETLLDPESFGIQLFNQFALLADHADNREVRYSSHCDPIMYLISRHWHIIAALHSRWPSSRNLAHNLRLGKGTPAQIRRVQQPSCRQSTLHVRHQWGVPALQDRPPSIEKITCLDQPTPIQILHSPLPPPIMGIPQQYHKVKHGTFRPGNPPLNSPHASRLPHTRGMDRSNLQPMGRIRSPMDTATKRRPIRTEMGWVWVIGKWMASVSGVEEGGRYYEPALRIRYRASARSSAVA